MQNAYGNVNVQSQARNYDIYGSANSQSQQNNTNPYGGITSPSQKDYSNPFSDNLGSVSLDKDSYKSFNDQDSY